MMKSRKSRITHLTPINGLSVSNSNETPTKDSTPEPAEAMDEGRTGEERKHG